MKTNYAHISIVLDRSGSMNSIRNDTIGGFNQFLKDQQAVPGEATITLVQFDDQVQSVYSAIPISDAPPLNDKTFVPRASTALLDAIGRTINDLGAVLSQLPEDARPEKVVFVIITDGEENASREFSLQQINEMIERQRKDYAWEFVFLGANQDAIKAGVDMGIAAGAAISYAADSAGVADIYSGTSRHLTDYRQGRVKNLSYSADDRDKQRRSGTSGGFKN